MNILLICDSTINRDALQCLIEKTYPASSVIACDSSKAPSIIESGMHDVIVADISMPEGVACIRPLRDVHRQPPSMNNKDDGHSNAAPTILLTSSPGPSTTRKAYEIGASWIISKASPSSDLLRAINAAVRLSNGTDCCLSDDDGCGPQCICEQRLTKRKSKMEVSPRERSVAGLIALGCTSKEIARKLNISPHTVGVHRKNIMHKLGIHSSSAIAHTAILEGWTNVDESGDAIAV